jgi:hypothetical protein
MEGKDGQHLSLVLDPKGGFIPQSQTMPTHWFPNETCLNTIGQIAE